MTTHPIDLPSTGRVVAYRAPITDHLFCAPCGQSDRSTALTSDDLPDGGVCVGCGVDVLIPQEVAPESDDPRLALMSRLNTPPYDGPSGKYCTPLDEAARLLDDYRAAVLREAADKVFALDYDVMVGEEGDENLGSMREAWDLGTVHAVSELNRMAGEAQQGG